MSWEQVRQIRERRLAGETMRSLAHAFGITHQAVYMICSNRTWNDPNYTPPSFGGKKSKEPVKRGRGRPRKNP